MKTASEIISDIAKKLGVSVHDIEVTTHTNGTITVKKLLDSNLKVALDKEELEKVQSLFENRKVLTSSDEKVM